MVAVARVVSEFWGSVLYYTRPFHDVFFYYIYLIFMGKTKPLPPIINKILLMSATDLAEKIRKRELKSEEVVRAYVERAQAVQPHINAITDARYEEALEDARKIDKFLATGEKSPEELEKNTPLLGVPFSCKEAIGVKDLAQTAGIVLAKDRKCDKDSDAASLYRSAGAIPLTVTNVPEYCMWWDSSNLNFGICRNPYNNHRTVGGSTGGEGALLTSAGAIIGIGNDIGGSIRIPSSFNGIYGHKPTRGVISNKGSFPDLGEEDEKVDHLVGTGPMCRYVEDLPFLFKILSANDQRLKPYEKVDFHKVKIYYIETFPGKTSAIPELRKAVKKAANYFEVQYGIKPVPLRIDELENAFNLWEGKYLETGVSPFKLCLADESGNVNLWLELLKSIFGLSQHTLPVIYFSMTENRDKNHHYYECLKKFEKVQKKFLDIFKEDAVVLLPTHAELPPYYHLTIPKFANVGYTCIFNSLGFPATNIPAGLCDGLPMGIQAVSGYFNDYLTIAAAQELDKCFGGWKGPSAISAS